MNRPTEQLIRDYLNRLSLAAKTRLGPGDRQALLDHTRARIDAECGGAAHPTAEQVRRTLAGLGDPIALVENEHSRIAARKARDEDAGSRLRGDAAAGSRANGSPRQVWPPPATPAIARQPFMPPVVIPPATANAQVSFALPATTTSSPAASPAVSVSPPVLPSQPIPASPPVQGGGRVSAGKPVPSVQPVPANGPAVAGEAVERVEPASASNGAWAGPPVSPSEVPPDPAPANGPAQAASPSSENRPERPGPARPTSPTAPRGLPPLRGVPAPRGAPAPNESSASGGEPAPPGGAGRGAGGSAGSNGLSLRPPATRPAPESTQSGQRSSSQAGGAASGPGKPEPEPQPVSKAADEDQPAIEFSSEPADVEVQRGRMAVVGDNAVRQLRRLGPALLTIALRDRLETISLLLLGIGGAIYPPIWLVGALIAVLSKKWDLRDKWLGLALPVVAVVIGSALEVTFGAHFAGYWPYLVEAWVAAGRLSRIAAVLGALFLLWRIHKHGGARAKRLPPWSPERKPGR